MDQIPTKQAFVALYKEAEERADAAPNGISFSIEDRSQLNDLRVRLGMNATDAAFLVADKLQPTGAVVLGSLSRASSRFNLWERQAKKGLFRRNLVSTDPEVPVVQAPVEVKEITAPVRRINCREDVPTSFNTALPQLLDVGVGLPEALVELTAAYARAQSKVAEEQKQALDKFPKSFQRAVLTELLTNLKD